jgi:hypothetical protein
MAMGGESATITAPAVHLESGFTDLPTDILGGHPLPQHGNRTAQRSLVAGLAMMAMLAGGCKSNPIDAPPPTIETAQAAQSPATTTTPAGQVLPLPGNSHSAGVAAGRSTGSRLFTVVLLLLPLRLLSWCTRTCKLELLSGQHV